MSAGTYDISLEAGATFVVSIAWVDENSTPIDMTNYTARMQMRRNVNSNVFMVELTTENGKIVYTNQAAGRFNLSLSAADTDPLLDGVYDLEVISGGGIVTRLLEGTVTVSKNVTR